MSEKNSLPTWSRPKIKKFQTNIEEVLTGTVESVSIADGEAIVLEFKIGTKDKEEVVSLGCETDEKTIDRLLTILAKANHTGNEMQIGVVGDNILWVQR